MSKRIELNRIQCVHCDDVITSEHRHDFVTCKCGTVSADGGKSYLKRSFKAEGDYIDLSIERDTSWENDDAN